VFRNDPLVDEEHRGLLLGVLENLLPGLEVALLLTGEVVERVDDRGAYGGPAFPCDGADGLLCGLAGTRALGDVNQLFEDLDSVLLVGFVAAEGERRCGCEVLVLRLLG